MIDAAQLTLKRAFKIKSGFTLRYWCIIVYDGLHNVLIRCGNIPTAVRENVGLLSAFG